jgi:Ca-activated chloride channel family protein
MIKFRLLLVILTLALGVTASAQQKDRTDQRPAATIRIDTDLVTIDVTAIDKNGNYVRDLRAEEFQVFEDGKLKTLNFFAMTDESALSRPLAVVFALDTSGSLKPDEIQTLREAAMKFTELMSGESVFAAMAFNYNVKILQGFTDDPRKLEKAFAKADRFEGSTRIYDALDRAITMLSRQAPRTRKNRPVRRVIIVISDGFDSASMIDRHELIRRANAGGVTVYSVTLPSYILSPTQTADRVITPLDAARIVAATGGRDFAADARDFTPIFKALAEEIRASYALAYYPEWRDGKSHDLRVKTSRQGVQLRVNRTSFQAPGK